MQVREPKGRVVVIRDDAAGSVFARAADQKTPIYSYGPAGATMRSPMFSCPQSAIPEEVWDLLMLWWQSRQLHALPYGGGLLDQPEIVRFAFPLFEHQMQLAEQSGGTAERAASLALGGMMKVLGRR